MTMKEKEIFNCERGSKYDRKSICLIFSHIYTVSVGVVELGKTTRKIQSRLQARTTLAKPPPPTH